MKKTKLSAILIAHIIFWIMIWFLLFAFMIIWPISSEASVEKNPFIGLFINHEVYRNAALVVCILSIPFYGSFLYTRLIIKNLKNIIYPIILIVIYFILHLYLGGYNEHKYIDASMTVVIILLFGLLGGLFQFFTDWFKKNQLKVELELKNYESNFALLRFQINPHFLFNTLNNIDTLIYEDSQNASKSLVKLSDIMRYMLHEAKSEQIELKKEIEHIENYLSLEKLRLKNDNFLSYSISGDYLEKRIAPMLLISFVENAFKHCVDSNIEKGIVIDVKIDEDKLHLTCENQFNESEKAKDKVQGIGLKIVKKRLELIYPEKHKLEINAANSVFRVKLEIQIQTNEN